MALFKLMFIIEYRKNPTMSYLKIKFKFFTSKYGDKWSICDKMTLCARMGGLLGDLTTIVWIVKYLQRSNTFEIKYQNILCFNVEWIIFNLSLYI
jgi:hypothetical protein